MCFNERSLKQSPRHRAIIAGSRKLFGYYRSIKENMYLHILQMETQDFLCRNHNKSYVSAWVVVKIILRLESKIIRICDKNKHMYSYTELCSFVIFIFASCLLNVGK